MTVQHVKPHMRDGHPVRGYIRRGRRASRVERKAYKSLEGLGKFLDSIEESEAYESLEKLGEFLRNLGGDDG